MPSMSFKDRPSSPRQHGRSDSSVPLLPSPLRSELGWQEESEDEAVPAFVRAKTSPSSPSSQPKSRLRTLMLLGSTLSLLSIATLLFFYASAPSYSDVVTVEEVCSQPPVVELAPNRLDVIQGSPTPHYRDNLRNDTKYITSWLSAGWTNDVMTYGNLIYLGMITGRVPVLPMFTPSHIGGDVPPVWFGEVFDVPRLSHEIGIPIVEWHEVKDPASEEVDDLGCWNLWQAQQHDAVEPRNSPVPAWLKLDLSYTRAPAWVKRQQDNMYDPHSTFWALATLGFPQTRANSIGEISPSPVHQAVLEPDEQLLCMDYLYYVCAQNSFEYEFDYAPAWREVVSHFHWTQRLEGIADEYLRNLFNITEDQEIPPFITIHARHGDFGVYCEDRPKEECFAQPPVFNVRVNEIKQEILERKGISVEHVIMTSDERDPVWWQQTAAMGWYAVDHAAAQTAERFGRWYPLLLDAVFQSRGLGFVGTESSTMSILAKRRVEDWHDGVTRMVEWGWPDSDNHKRRRALDD